MPHAEKKKALVPPVLHAFHFTFKRWYKYKSLHKSLPIRGSCPDRGLLAEKPTIN